MHDAAIAHHPSPVAVAYDDNQRRRAPAATPTAGAPARPHQRQTALVGTQAQRLRAADAAFAHWAAGYGLVHHDDATQVRMHHLAARLVDSGAAPSTDQVWRLMAAADRLCSGGMWLVVHQTYARRVHLDGRPLRPDDFKERPEGHTGGALNMVPAYVGYLVANALSGLTRAWVMGPGHCVSAIDAINLLVGNQLDAQAQRYGLDEARLADFVQDFYSYRAGADGSVAAPMGSHVGPHTAGGISEGGYLGFAELQYPHMPLKGERLVAFLSDGAFEEQRGADWAPRWWRAEDCGLVSPILIANGRRIDGRTAIDQNGGAPWLEGHLQLNSFEPTTIDGRDPAAFAWAIIDGEERLQAWSAAIAAGEACYPVPLPYAIAEAPKGYGFPGQATNDAHNLPLGANPFHDDAARRRFNAGAHALHVPLAELTAAAATLNNHAVTGRAREKDHALADRRPAAPTLPDPSWAEPAGRGATAPMAALDEMFAAIVAANPRLRPRVGNPDEMRSNRLNRTLDLLKHRVAHAEPGMAEDVLGAVITALNEEAVACACLGNKGGINLVASYEAFAMKMLGAFRQELIFARHQADLGRAPGWLSVPMVLTSHTWENGKNEQSHQDPTFAEAMIAEMNDVSRAVFPVDANTAVEALRACYRTRGQIWTLVVPKNPMSDLLTVDQARALVRDGAVRLRGDGSEPLALIAVGAYQAAEAVRASDRLRARGVGHALIMLGEPGRFRVARDRHEAQALADAPTRAIVGSPARRVLLTHTRPEAIAGLAAEWGGRTACLGYRNRGGTLDVGGMLFANGCTWAHAVARAAILETVAPETLLDAAELAAIAGTGDPTLIARGPQHAALAARAAAR
ncbi:MAG TPA: xylulose 5-phosphate 3-epimerase [Planctomycetota bacterium]|nr:xylulose 5-phosphate 3-epimerase [Planctomycetota bacterium]